MVFAGGAVGSLIRYGVSLAFPRDGLVPWDVVLVNTVGALLLGALVGWLGRAAGPTSSVRARHQRLLWGTGALGGFTTYSALALGAVDLVRDDRALAAMLLAVGSVAVGLAACGAGLALGSLAARGRARAS